MPYIPYGVDCKTQNCNTAIIMGEVWQYDRPLKGGDRIEFVVLRPTTVRCPACHREYEYDQRDLRKYPQVQSLPKPNDGGAQPNG